MQEEASWQALEREAQVTIHQQVPLYSSTPASLADGAVLSVRLERGKVVYKKSLDRPFCTLSLLSPDGSQLEPPVRCVPSPGKPSATGWL